MRHLARVLAATIVVTLASASSAAPPSPRPPVPPCIVPAAPPAEICPPRGYINCMPPIYSQNPDCRRRAWLRAHCPGVSFAD